ncbi:MAG: hypothetical protein ACREMY_13805, partial [bacterium]
MGGHSSAYDDGWKRNYRAIQVSGATGWADVAAGTYDTDLADLVTDLSALSADFNPSNPFILCFHHETTVSWGSYGTAQEFIDAFRYVRDYLDAASMTVYSKTGEYLGGPIQMAYIGWNRMFTNGAVDSPPVGESYTDLDPDQGSSPAPAGTSYYEWCGSDVYNQVLSAGTLKYGTDAATLLDDIVAQATSRGKDFIIGEFGVGDGSTQADHDNKADFLTSAKDYFITLGQDGPGVCRGIWLTIKSSVDKFNVDSSPDAQAAYRDFVTDPYFGKQVRANGAVVRQGRLVVADSVATTAVVKRALTRSITATVATVGKAKRKLSHTVGATVGTTAKVVRKGLLSRAVSVAVAAAAALRRAIPTSPYPEASNSIEVQEELNQTVLNASANEAVVELELNQIVISDNGVNT